MNSHLFSWFQLTLGFLGIIGLFLVFFALIALIVVRKTKSSKEIKVEVKSLNKHFKEHKMKLLQGILEPSELKKFGKEEAEKTKLDKKMSKLESNKHSSKAYKKRFFVLDFQGDVSASCLPVFREQISALLQVVNITDEVIVRLESPGGYVHAYGLAASQLARIRERKIPLTICVDKVAASGGYMMACLGDKIIAAPFSILGSVGVIANVPNINRLMKKNDVDYYEMTAGEYKRTLTLLGEVTEKGKQKFQDQLEETHELFKNHIKNYRSQVNIESIATGEYWLGTKALEFCLVDELKTSDDYIIQACDIGQVYQIFTPKKETLRDKLLGVSTKVFEKFEEKTLDIKKNYPLFL